VANDLDIVAVGIEDKCIVVIRMILGSQSRRAVVGSSGSEGGLPYNPGIGSPSDLRPALEAMF
jgi:hypothetical protein